MNKYDIVRDDGNERSTVGTVEAVDPFQALENWWAGISDDPRFGGTPWEVTCGCLRNTEVIETTDFPILEVYIVSPCPQHMKDAGFTPEDVEKGLWGENGEDRVDSFYPLLHDSARMW
jgi:hypothetical protein